MKPAAKIPAARQTPAANFRGVIVVPYTGAGGVRAGRLCLLNREELDIEGQGRVGADYVTKPLRSVRELGRNEELEPGAHSHELQSLSPTRDRILDHDARGVSGP